MTNREKYLDEILAKSLTCDLICRVGETVICNTQYCDKCEEKVIAWLKAEYKEPEHTHDECEYAKRIEGIKHMRYCSKRTHTINGTETINGCKDFSIKENLCASCRYGKKIGNDIFECEAGYAGGYQIHCEYYD